MAKSNVAWFVSIPLVCVLTISRAESLNSTTMGRKHFAKAPYCPSQILASYGRYRTVSARSTIECMAHCRPDVECHSIVYDPVSKHCQLGDSRAFDNCSNMEPAGPHEKFYHDPPPCGVAQTLGLDGVCICLQGYTGYPNCKRYLADCDDVYNYGRWHGDDVYDIQPLLASQPFPVYCRFISNARTYLMQRKKDGENFYRPWSDYAQGFGDLLNNHFLGLEKAYAITNDYKKYELRVVIKNKTNDRFYENPYREFRIGSAASGYPLYFNVTDYLPTPPSGCFITLSGAKFSTYDRDNDGVASVNCAVKREAGFWFHDSSCNTCNPTGQLLQPASGNILGVAREVFWTTVLGNAAPFKIDLFLILLSDPNNVCWPCD